MRDITHAVAEAAGWLKSTSSEWMQIRRFRAVASHSRILSRPSGAFSCAGIYVSKADGP